MLLSELDHKLHCWAWNRIYIKANGRVPCWCDAAEDHTVVAKEFGDVDFVTDILNSEEMRNMRCKILENKMYINKCSQCCCLITAGGKRYKRYQDSEVSDNVQKLSAAAYNALTRTSKTRNWPMGSIDKISEIQLEPSFPCTLRCPGCIHGVNKSSLSTEKPPYMFPLEWFKHMIDCCKKHTVTINRIQYCGKGEPTLNKFLPEMIKYAANIEQSMDTNCNQEFNDSYLLLNKINCSIDGATSESYSKYRRRGNFNKAMNFMKKAVCRKKETKSNCKIRWKYILFNTTESVDQLSLAQEIARDIGIDELDFVITACGAQDMSVLPPINMNTISKVSEYLHSNRIFDKTVVSRS